MKKYADKKRRYVPVDTEEWVFLKLRPHIQMIANRIYQKLSTDEFRPLSDAGKNRSSVLQVEATRVCKNPFGFPYFSTEESYWKLHSRAITACWFGN